MAKKEKPKKEKKKKQKNDQAEGEKKGGKKKLLLLVPVLAGVGAGVYFFVLNGGGLPFLGGGKDKPIDVYAVEDEMVASVTAALEECGEQTLMSITTNVAPPDAEPAEGEEGAEGEEEEKKDEEKEEENKDEEKDDKKKDKDAPNRGEAQYIDEGEGGDGTRWTYYYYKIGETTVADLNAYTEFLNEEGFELVSGGGTDEETSALGIYQKEAETEEDHIFSIEMEYPLAGDAATGQYVIKARLEKKPEVIVENVQTMSRDDALRYMAGLDYTKLGLEYPLSEYNMTLDMGRTYIDGKDCYGINIYTKGNQENGGNFVKKFYLSLADKKIYEYLDNDIFDLQSVSSTYPQFEQNSTIPAGQGGTTGQGDTAEQDMTGQGGTGGAPSGAGVHDWEFGPME